MVYYQVRKYAFAAFIDYRIHVLQLYTLYQFPVLFYISVLSIRYIFVLTNYFRDQNRISYNYKLTQLIILHPNLSHRL